MWSERIELSQDLVHWWTFCVSGSERCSCQRTEQLHSFASKGTRADGILQERQKSSLFAINVGYHRAEVTVSGNTYTPEIYWVVIAGCVRRHLIIFAYTLKLFECKDLFRHVENFHKYFILSTKSHIHLLSLRSFIQEIRPGPRLFVIFRNNLIFYSEALLDENPNPKL